MGSLSIWHILVLLLPIAGLLLLVPISKVLSRLGISPWLSILFLVPVVGYVAIWIFAFARWPKVDERAT